MPTTKSAYNRIPISTSVVVMGFLAALFILGTFVAMAMQRKADLLEERQAGNTRLSESLAAHADGVFRQAGLILHMLGDQISEEGGSELDAASLRAHMAMLLQHGPMISALRLIRPDGSYANSVPEQPESSVNVGDRDYVMAHLGSHRGLYLGKPVVSRVNGRNLLPLSLDYRDSQGRLVAVMAAMISLDATTVLFESVRHKPNGTVGLFSSSGLLLNRAPASENMLGKDFSSGPLFRQYLPQARHGSYTSVVATDNKMRQASYRSLDAVPALVSVSSLHDDIMEVWQAYVRTLASIGAPMILAVGVITTIMFRQVRAHEQVQALLARRTDQLELAHEELRHVAELSAHHLQEPLRTVLAYSQLLVRSLPEATQPEPTQYLEYIRSGIERMKGQLEALQRYLGLNSGAEPIELDMGRVVGDIAHQLRDRLKQVRLGYRQEPLPRLVGDRRHMDNLFLNLLTALSDPTHVQKDGRISVSASEEDQGWVIRVVAEGVHIPQTTGDMAFPVLEAGSGANHGTSVTLRLAICRKIVHLHGGNMSMEAENGSIGIRMWFPKP